VLLVDDTVVRGTNGPYVISELKKAGAKAIYFLVASDLYLSGDLYGSGDTYRDDPPIAQICKNELLGVPTEVEREYTEEIREQIIERVRNRFAISPEDGSVDQDRVPDGLFYLPIMESLDAIIAAGDATCPLTRDSFYLGPFTGRRKDYQSGAGDFASAVGF